MVSYDEWLKIGAHELVYNDELRLDRIILEQMLKLSKGGIVPLWMNYKNTSHWKIVQNHLTAEQQFVFRSRYLKIFKETWLEKPKHP